MVSMKEFSVDAWGAYKARCGECTSCHRDQLLDERAFPIFQKEPPRSTDVLFVLEAPNRDDTYDPQKQHLTIDPETDPTGRLFFELFTEVARRDIRDLFVTNSVLCLPGVRGASRSVTHQQTESCSRWLGELIREADPLVVCPLGTKALKALGYLEPHGLTKMKEAVALPKPWQGRVLFPLYHTSRQVVNSPTTGRSRAQQIEDWSKLRNLLALLSR